MHSSLKISLWKHSQFKGPHVGVTISCAQAHRFQYIISIKCSFIRSAAIWHGEKHISLPHTIRISFFIPPYFDLFKPNHSIFSILIIKWIQHFVYISIINGRKFRSTLIFIPFSNCNIKLGLKLNLDLIQFILEKSIAHRLLSAKCHLNGISY